MSIEIITPQIFEPNTTSRVSAFVHTAGVPITSATVSANLQRSSDSFWWNGSAWQVGVTSFALTEVSPTNMPGLYEASLPWATMEPTFPEGQYTLRVTHLTTAAFQVLEARHGLRTLPISDLVAPAPAAACSLEQLLSALKASLLNNQSVNDSTKQQVIFMADGTTAAVAFQCMDAASNASIREVFRKVRV